MTRILLVDDHAIVRRGLRDLLREARPDAELREATDIPAARAALHDGGWQLVVLDINLPGGSGLDLIPQVRERCPQAAVLVLSAYPEQEFALRALRLGASGYLTKSSVADELLSAVERALRGGRYVSASLAQHLAEALDAPATPHDALSPRELDVLRRVASGQTIKEIAAELHLSDKTVATYRARIAEKLSLSSNVELARYALRHGLVD